MMQVWCTLLIGILAFLAAAEDIDEIVKIVQYDYDHDKIKQIITFEDDYKVMRIKENDYIYPIEYGKLLVYMKKYEWKDVQLAPGDVTIIFEQSENQQFFFFRIGGIIPSEDGTRGYLRATSRVTVKYMSTASVFGIFQEGTTSKGDSNADAAVGISYTRVFPAESKSYIKRRIIDVYEAITNFNVGAQLTEDLHSRLFEIHDGLFGGDQIIFDDSIPYDNIQKLTKWKTEMDPLHLEPGEVIYANSDESFHFWIDDNGKDAYIVDVGSLFFTNGLHAIVENTQDLETLYIIQTHFHSEHIQGLAPLINRTEIDQIVMMVSTGLNLEFVGWLLENYGHVAEKIENQELVFLFAEDDEWVQLGPLEAKLLLSNKFEDNRIKHFISNTSPVLRDKDNNFRIFTGDLQGPSYSYIPDEEFYEMVASSISQIFEAGEVSESSSIDYFFGIGLFYWQMLLYPWQIGEEDRTRVKDLFSHIYEEFSNYPQLDFQLIHITNGLGFNMALHESFSKKTH